MQDSNKAAQYEELLRLGDVIQRETSKLKSQYPIQMPEKEQKIIYDNNLKMIRLTEQLRALQSY